MKTLLVSVFVSILSVGCGGSMNNSGPTSTPPASTKVTQEISAGALAGFHGSTAKTTTTHSFSLLPKVYAQTTTSISLTGGYSGFMSSSPPGEQPPVSGPAAYPIYGVGSFDIRCSAGNTSTNGCPFAQATSTMSAGQALAAQALTTSQSNVVVNPNYVTGDGTLGPLVVYGTAAGVTGGTALFEVWVLRGGSVVSTGISCSFTATLPPTTQPLRCTSSQTFSVQDEDQIVSSVTLDTASLTNVIFFLGKN